MKNITPHILYPLLSPAFFFLVVANPGNALSCRMRGSVALLIALASLLAALAVMLTGAKRKLRKDPDYSLWVLSSLILAIPAVGVILLA